MCIRNAANNWPTLGAPTVPWNRWFNFWVPLGEDSEDDSEKDNDIGEEEFVGNIVMFWCIGLLILVLHVLVVSAVEAYWLQSTKVLAHLMDLNTILADERIAMHHFPLIFFFRRCWTRSLRRAPLL